MSGSWILFIVIIVSSVPVIAVYVWFRLAKYKYSSVIFLFALLAGAAAVFPALILQSFLNITFPAGTRLTLFYEEFIRIAFTEEISRLLVLLLFFFIYNRIKLDDSSDQPFSFKMIIKGTAIGFIAGLGFALLENARYVITDMNTNLLLLRAVTAAPLHGACGARIGAASVMFRNSPFQAVSRILTATAIHSIYNILFKIPGSTTSIAAILIAFSALTTTIITIIGSREDNDNPQNSIDKTGKNL
jgi:RsiW-degrading membrane proteinase PrsW (M82 family)